MIALVWRRFACQFAEILFKDSCAIILMSACSDSLDVRGEAKETVAAHAPGFGEGEVGRHDLCVTGRKADADKDAASPVLRGRERDLHRPVVPLDPPALACIGMERPLCPDGISGSEPVLSLRQDLHVLDGGRAARDADAVEL